jgi:hypothetical protein
MRRMNIYPNQEWVVRTLRKMNGMKMGFRVAVDWENQVCSNPSTPAADTLAPITISTVTKRARDSDVAFERHAKRVQLTKHVPLPKAFSQVCA